MRILAALLAFSILLGFVPLASAGVFIDSTEDDFNSGDHSSTQWDDSGYVRLEDGFSDGTFESRVFDAEYESIWQKISWTEGMGYGDALPDNGGVSGGINMTGNTMLYHMNETEGFVVQDSSGNGYDGDIIQSVGLGQPGKFGYSFEFEEDGGDCVSASSNALDELTDFTFEAWFKTVKTGNQALVSGANSERDNEFFIFFNDNTKVSLYLKGTDYIHTLPSISDGKWHYIVWTRRTANARQYIYFDGSEKGSNSVPVTPLEISVGGLIIGEDQDEVGGDFSREQSFDGYIDEVAIYNRALSQSEIKDRYHRGILDLKFQVRSDDDDSGWGDFIGPDATKYTYFTVNENSGLLVNSNRYFQYKAFFSTGDPLYSPNLINSTVEYEISNQAPEKPSLVSPENNAVFGDVNYVTLEYISTDYEDDEIHYYVFVSAEEGFTADGSTLVYSGTYNEKNYYIPGLDRYYWKVLASDGVLNSTMSNENSFEVKADILPPAISDEHITQNITEGQLVTLTANISDDSEITAWLNIKKPDGKLNTYSMSEESGTWKSVFIAGGQGSYEFKVNASDSSGNSNNDRPWNPFTISASSVCNTNNICEPASGETYENCAEDCCQEGSTKPCGSNVGACEQGTRTCSGGVWGSCINETTPAEEICNSIDDDCDGYIDEGLDCSVCTSGQTKPCGSNIGECKQGIMLCINGQWGGCQNSVYPLPETCDGKDNDCDGITDEGCDCIAGEEKPCGSNIGACEYGTKKCVNGKWGSCEGNVLPSTEKCGNSIDDDCDGTVDEGCEGVAAGETSQEVIQGELPSEQGLLGQEVELVPIILIITGIAIWVIGFVLYFRKRGKAKKQEEGSDKREDSTGGSGNEEGSEESGDELIITGQLRRFMQNGIQKLLKLTSRK